MVKFTKEMDKYLIELVKSHRVLYDANEDDFKNNIAKHKCWEEISFNIHVSVPECKKRWRNLRDQYNKKRKGDPKELTNSNWEYMSLLSFLSDPLSNTAERRDSTSNYTTQEIFPESQNTEEPDWVDDHEYELPIVDEVSQNYSLNTDGTTQHRRFAPKRTSIEPILNYMARRDAKRSALYEKLLNKSSTVKTPTSKFFESMAEVVDKLPPRLQAEIRLKVCQIVTETELKHHGDQQA